MGDISTVLIFIVGMIAGWFYREHRARVQVLKLLKVPVDLTKLATLSSDEDRLAIKIEKHDGEFFVYSAENKEFMANGSTRKELELRLETRYPGQRFECHPDNLKEVGL